MCRQAPLCIQLQAGEFAIAGITLALVLTTARAFGL